MALEPLADRYEPRARPLRVRGACPATVSRRILLDTRPLLGFVLPRAHYHAWAVTLLRSVRDGRPEVPCPLTSALELRRNLRYIKPPRMEQALETVRKVFTLKDSSTIAFALLQLPNHVSHPFA